MEVNKGAFCWKLDEKELKAIKEIILMRGMEEREVETSDMVNPQALDPFVLQQISRSPT